MKKLLDSQYTGRQIVGFLLACGSAAYLLYVLLIWAISSSTYM